MSKRSPRLSRRALITTTAIATGASLTAGASAASAGHADAPIEPGPVSKPPVLAEGDTVAVVSPAGPTVEADVNVGVDLLRSWGLNVELADHALDSFGYLAAPDKHRLADLNAALNAPGVKAVMATRGGYGSQRIVEQVVFAETPKLLIGYSDITTLHLASHKAGVASLHSPMAAWDADNNTAATEKALRDAIMTTNPVIVERDPDIPTSQVKVGGTATGPLIGGNLTMLSTEPIDRNFPDLSGAILFIEEINEAPYLVDQMLTQLLRAGALDEVAAIALGQFLGEASDDGWDLPEVLAERLAGLEVPILGGLPVGHGQDPRVLPLGVEAELDATAGTLTVESAVG
ncbi:MAG TPA: LD-carboxypeptidase [Candidatus Stackebrandtia faecavium]|nr:LD-carboxypeptidase [Candidatus Stackebrandtia faecavium]